MVKHHSNPVAQQVVPFLYESHEVKTLLFNDAPWFVARDVCNVLGLDDTHKALLKLDDDEMLTRKLFVSGQNRQMWLISESGLYALILRSNKPEAKPFRKWVTSEVLPSIRKTGRYEMTPSVETGPGTETPVLSVGKYPSITPWGYVSAYDLYDCLGIEQPFGIWFYRCLDSFMDEGIDYERIDGNAQTPTDYLLRFNRAIEVSLFTRTPRGKDVGLHLDKIRRVMRALRLTFNGRTAIPILS